MRELAQLPTPTMATRTRRLRLPRALLEEIGLLSRWLASRLSDGIRYLLVSYGWGHRHRLAGDYARRFPDELVEALLEVADRLAIERAPHLATGAAGADEPGPAHHAQVPRE